MSLPVEAAFPPNTTLRHLQLKGPLQSNLLLRHLLLAAAPAKPAPAAKTVPAATVKTETGRSHPECCFITFGTRLHSRNKRSESKAAGTNQEEHLVYRKAFMDAEMGLRYFYKTQYDAKYRGAKAPTEEELKAMRLNSTAC